VTQTFFVSDLHGRVDRYRKLFAAIEAERPAAVFLGGDLLPSGLFSAIGLPEGDHFIRDFLVGELSRLRATLNENYPRVILILGNDDARGEEALILDLEASGLWEYAHGRRLELRGYAVYGYAFVPPTPFQLKDWERYDVSRYVDPGCVPPDGGFRTVPVEPREIEHGTIDRDLRTLAGDDDQTAAVWLFHAPPYDTALDRAALDGQMVDHAPLDVHVGSIAIRRFIEARRPLLTLHGHIHESARLTGTWRDQIGRTHALSAAHDGPELALVCVDLDDPAAATRSLR
jgi:Icc-related predicted phosphoesterase